MRQVCHGLNEGSEAFEGRLIQGQRQDERHRDANEQLEQADDDRVTDQLVEVERFEKGDEVVETGKWTFPDPQQRFEILEGNLSIPEWKVLENDKVRHSRKHHEIQPAIFHDVFPHR